MGANRFLAVPSPHGRLVLRAWLAAERSAARTCPPSPRAATTLPGTVADRLPKLAAHRLSPPHFMPLAGAARKFAVAPKPRARLGLPRR